MSCGLPEMSGVIEMARGRDWRRFQRYRTIQRKVDILRGIDGDENVKAWTAGGTKIGRLSKGKIHCSCWMCRVKSYDYRSHMDARRIQGMADEEHEWRQDEGTDQEDDPPLKAIYAKWKNIG